MSNWLCFSSAYLINWEEHPIPLQAEDFSWASGDAFAPYQPDDFVAYSPNMSKVLENLLITLFC